MVTYIEMQRVVDNKDTALNPYVRIEKCNAEKS